MLAMNTTQWRQRILLYSDDELCPKDADRIQHIAQVAVMSIFTMQCLPGRNSAVNSVTNVGYMSFHTRTILSLSQSVKSHHCHCQSPFELHLPSAETDPQRHTVKWTGSSAASCSRTLWQHTQLLIDVLSAAAIKSVTFLLQACICIKTSPLWYGKWLRGMSCRGLVTPAVWKWLANILFFEWCVLPCGVKAT